MQAVGIKLLKNRLSEFVRMAAAGETILVLNRQRVVAQLNPPSPRAPLGVRPTEEQLLEQGVRDGWITPPKRSQPKAPLNVPMVKLQKLLADLDQARADRDLSR